ncbi:MAG: cobaltochelatase subunit CobN [Deltaproteobacteria bacterium]|nr:cobaltochelatase subunit CobN [Deltaproteobacteria bacterium]
MEPGQSRDLGGHGAERPDGEERGRTAHGERRYSRDAPESGAAVGEARKAPYGLGPQAALARKVAVLYCNDSRGKHSIFAAFLNVFRSLADIVARLRAEGFAVDDDPPLDEGQVKALVKRGGRNVGAWRSENPDRKRDCGHVAGFVVPGAFRRARRGVQTERPGQWGPFEEVEVKTLDGKPVLPVTVGGNLVVIPQPGALPWVVRRVTVQARLATCPSV